MNKWCGISLLLLILFSSSDLNIFLRTEACNTISYIECVNSTYYVWCVDNGNGTLTTVGDAESCPSNLVCNDAQANGCVVATTVSNDTTTTTTTATTDVTPENAATSTEVDNSSEASSTEVDTSTETSSTEVKNSSEASSTEVENSSVASSTEVDTSTETSSTEVGNSSEASAGEVTTSKEDDTTDSATTEDTSFVLSDADFICIYEGFYKAQDCSRYHVCYKVIWFITHYLARCSKGLYWSSSEKSCVLKSLSDCP